MGLNEIYHSQKQMDQMYDFLDHNVTMLYSVTIEELTVNELFSFNAKEFCESFAKEYDYIINTFYFFKINRFTGWNNSTSKFKSNVICAYVNRKVPSLSLKKKYEQGEGWTYHYVLFEFSYNGKKEFFLWYTTNNDLIRTIRKKYSDIEMFIICRRDKKTYSTHIMNATDYGIISKNSFTNFIMSLNLASYGKKYKDFLRNNLKYIIVDKTIKSLDEVNITAKSILNNAYTYYYDNFEKGSLVLPPTKWKSEYQVKELCEKLFGKNNVIYQYKPFFLQSQKGQLSYDIFLIKQKIAIEYQGKQHFEPVKYFGGQLSFEKQQERDRLKKELSAKNRIKLIYINYWEPLNTELIISKISEEKYNES